MLKMNLNSPFFFFILFLNAAFCFAMEIKVAERSAEEKREYDIFKRNLVIFSYLSHDKYFSGRIEEALQEYNDLR